MIGEPHELWLKWFFAAIYKWIQLRNATYVLPLSSSLFKFPLLKFDVSSRHTFDCLKKKNHQFNLLNYCSALLNWRHIASPALWVYNTLGYTLVCFSRALLCRCRVVTLGCFGGTWWGLKRALSQVPIDHATRNWVSIRQFFFIALWIIIRGIPCDIYKDYVGNEQYKRQNRHFLLGRHW